MPDMKRDEAERLLKIITRPPQIYTAETAGVKAAERQAAIDAVIAAMTRATPGGWKLVPETPTPEMLRAAWNDGVVGGEREHRDIYAAMLAAAPEAP